MTLMDDIQFLLAKYHIKPRRSLGQSFCIDSLLFRRMITYSRITEKDVVLEIGAGFGFLTRLLSNIAKDVIALELDYRLIKALKENLHGNKNVRIIQGDFLKIPLPKFTKIVANPPYSISSKMILHLFNFNFQSAVLTLQKEFVKKLTAQKGNANYGSLSVIASYSASINELEAVPKQSFYPVPQIDSTVVLIKPKKPYYDVGDKRFYLKMVKCLFTHRNKKVKNALKHCIWNEFNITHDSIQRVVKELPYLDLKVNNLTPEKCGTISHRLHGILQEETCFK
jgi:16S rRNA (adenine1518-N6/adenine1519-N6)-dimethyltransferase